MGYIIFRLMIVAVLVYLAARFLYKKKAVSSTEMADVHETKKCAVCGVYVVAGQKSACGLEDCPNL